MWFYLEMAPLGGNWVSVRSRGWSPHDGLSALTGRDTGKLVCTLPCSLSVSLSPDDSFSALWMHMIRQPSASQENIPLQSPIVWAGIIIKDFQPPKNSTKINPIKPLGLWRFMAAWADEYKVLQHPVQGMVLCGHYLTCLNPSTYWFLVIPLMGQSWTKNATMFFQVLMSSYELTLVNCWKKELLRFGIPELNELNDHGRVSQVCIVMPMDFKQQKL